MLFGIIYIMGITNFFYLAKTFMGFLQLFGLMLGTLLAIMVFLHAFQALCRLVGINRIYKNFKENKANK